jgi:hypothetical protein
MKRCTGETVSSAAQYEREFLALLCNLLTLSNNKAVNRMEGLVQSTYNDFKDVRGMFNEKERHFIPFVQPCLLHIRLSLLEA